MDTKRFGEPQGSHRPSPCHANADTDTQKGVNELDFQRDVITSWLGRAGMLHVDPPHRKVSTR